MKEIVGFIKEYWRDANKPVLLLCILLMAVMIWLNYRKGLEYKLINTELYPYPEITGRVILYSTAFLIPVLLLFIFSKHHQPPPAGFIICVIAAPLLFALKAGLTINLSISKDPEWNRYWNIILYWPLRMLIITGALFIIWKIFHPTIPLYGLHSNTFNFTPYFIMLLIMLPLIAIASAQAGFLSTYPKLHHILPLPPGANPIWHKLLFEASYGSDFFTIEIFFRGFLVIGLMQWIGKDAILPMACFYCSIHFGKPMAECISSFFGGMLLGIVSYHTKSIYGGLIVHLGIAWMMEFGGFIGHKFLPK